MPLARKKSKPWHPAGVRIAMPASIEPMLPTLVTKPFSQNGWIYEPKWDGWRTIVFLRDGNAHLGSRKRNSLDERFPTLRDIGKLIKAETAVIDVEVVALDQDGLPRFDALRFKRERKCSVVFYAFDLLYLDGYDLTCSFYVCAFVEGVRSLPNYFRWV